MLTRSIQTALLIVFLSIPFVSYSQAEFSEGSSFMDRVYTGGNVGFSFSNNVTTIAISPIAGYMVNEKLSVGLGGTYQRNSFRNIDLTLNNYGARTFLRYNVTSDFFAYSEYEYLIFEFSDGGPGVQSEGFSSLFLGGGYAVPLGPRVSFLAIALYNVLYDDFRSPYPSPIVMRGGIVASF
ncbi:MAG: hypothetical protein WBA74_06395 [Cyclobacteriaceae bacterium]